MVDFLSHIALLHISAKCSISSSTLGEAKKFLNIFEISGVFSEKFASITLLGFECTINSQNLINIVGAIFEKINFLNFFLM